MREKENFRKSNVDKVERKHKIEEQNLIKNTLQQGDTLSYKKAFKIYILSNRYNEFLFIPLECLNCITLVKLILILTNY